MDTGLFYVLIGFLFFFSFLFTFLAILKLIRKKTTWAAVSVFVLVSGVLTVLVFKTDFIFEVSLSVLSWYCIIIFMVYIISRILAGRKEHTGSQEEPS